MVSKLKRLTVLCWSLNNERIVVSSRFGLQSLGFFFSFGHCLCRNKAFLVKWLLSYFKSSNIAILEFPSILTTFVRRKNIFLLHSHIHKHTRV